MIIQEVISDRVVELNPTTVDYRTDQAVLVVNVVVDWSASKWKSHLENLDRYAYRSRLGPNLFLATEVRSSRFLGVGGVGTAFCDRSKII